MLFRIFPLYYEKSLTISDSTGKFVSIESFKVRVVSLSITEISEMARLKIRCSGSFTLSIHNYVMYRHHALWRCINPPLAGARRIFFSILKTDSLVPFTFFLNNSNDIYSRLQHDQRRLSEQRKLIHVEVSRDARWRTQ